MFRTAVIVLALHRGQSHLKADQMKSEIADFFDVLRCLLADRDNVMHAGTGCVRKTRDSTSTAYQVPQYLPVGIRENTMMEYYACHTTYHIPYHSNQKPRWTQKTCIPPYLHTIFGYIYSLKKINYYFPSHLLSSPFSLPPSRNSDPGSHRRLFSPPTHCGSCLALLS